MKESFAVAAILPLMMLVGCAIDKKSADASVPQVPQTAIAEAATSQPAQHADTELQFVRISPKQYGIDYPDFYMLETEVTNAQFLAFLNETGRTKDDTPVEKIIEERAKRDWHSTGDISYSISDATTIWRNGRYPDGLEDFPVTLVTLEDAIAFCEWLTKEHPDRGVYRLPTWNEWMIAAYGSDRSYPWGDAWDRSRAHTSYGMNDDRPKEMTRENVREFFRDKRKTRAEDVRGRPSGRTPEGLFGMLGNVEEYLNPGDPLGEEYLNLGSRWMGGSFDRDPEASAPLSRQDYWGYSHHRVNRCDDLGFRVLLDPTGDLKLLARPRLFDQRDNRWRTPTTKKAK